MRGAARRRLFVRLAGLVLTFGLLLCCGVPLGTCALVIREGRRNHQEAARLAALNRGQEAYLAASTRDRSLRECAARRASFLDSSRNVHDDPQVVIDKLPALGICGGPSSAEIESGVRAYVLLAGLASDIEVEAEYLEKALELDPSDPDANRAAYDLLIEFAGERKQDAARAYRKRSYEIAHRRYEQCVQVATTALELDAIDSSREAEKLIDHCGTRSSRSSEKHTAQVERDRRYREWARAPLRCWDGSNSPECRCGDSSYQGCCSWHGGVAGCSKSR